jgi:hypothetical protein
MPMTRVTRARDPIRLYSVSQQSSGERASATLSVLFGPPRYGPRRLSSGGVYRGRKPSRLRLCKQCTYRILSQGKPVLLRSRHQAGVDRPPDPLPHFHVDDGEVLSPDVLVCECPGTSKRIISRPGNVAKIDVYHFGRTTGRASFRGISWVLKRPNDDP